MSKALATLAGEALSGDVSWTDTVGPAPFVGMFEEPNEVAAVIAKAGRTGRPLELVIGEARWSALYLVSVSPGSSPHKSMLEVADARWKLSKRWVEREFNARKRTGTRYLLGEGLIQNKPLSDDITYKPYSLRGFRTPWKVEDAIKSICEDAGVRFRIVDRMTREVTFENLTISGTAAEAIAQCLQYAPGYTVRVARDGAIEFFDRLSGRQDDAIERAGAVIIGSGYRGKPDRAPERPSEIRVLFEREQELRFNYEEVDTITRTIDPGRPPRELQNVMPVPDQQITINGVEVGRGTWVTIQEYLDAISSDALPVGATTRLSMRKLREKYLSKWYFDNLYALDKAGDKDVKWSRRIRTLLQHYRRTFRILPEYMALIRSVRAYRVAMLSAESGTRARANAYTDYTIIPKRRLFKQKRRDGRVLHSYYVEGYADDLTNGQAAPAFIRVLDQDNGVISVDWQTSLLGDDEAIIPGQLDNYQKLSAPDAFLAMVKGAKLASGWKMALVVTCISGSPNARGRLWEQRVTATEAEVALRLRIGDSTGDPEDRRVPSSETTTARFAWLDAEADAIDESFYTGRQAPPRRLLVNSEHVDNMADAVATGAYVGRTDQEEGEFEAAQFRENADLIPDGTIASITHAIKPRRGVRMKLSIPRIAEDANFLAFLDPETRSAVQRIVQP